MGEKLTKRDVDALQSADQDRFQWCGVTRGFGVKVTPRGHKTFLLVYRFPKGRAGKVRRWTIGTYGSLTVDQARDVAEIKLGELAKGIDPMAELEKQRAAAEIERKAEKTTLETIAASFIEKYAKRRNRRWAETQRTLERLVLPAWRKKRIGQITRADVVELLDRIEDQNGPVMAHNVLAIVRKLFNWHAMRDDRFNSPIVRGMARIKPSDIRRDRVLSDDEIRLLWRALDVTPSPYGQLVRFLLLTAQRREEVAQARRSEIDGTVWTIPAARTKSKQANVVPLSVAAQSVLRTLPMRSDLLFTTTGESAFSGFSKAKQALDRRMEVLVAEDLGPIAVLARKKAKKPLVADWRIHDLRRTAKTLMVRAGVRPDISERVLGHVIAGVAGVYDRHDYLAEKEHALSVLATEIQRITTLKRAIPEALESLAAE